MDIAWIAFAEAFLRSAEALLLGYVHQYLAIFVGNGLRLWRPNISMSIHISLAKNFDTEHSKVPQKRVRHSNGEEVSCPRGTWAATWGENSVKTEDAPWGAFSHLRKVPPVLTPPILTLFLLLMTQKMCRNWIILLSLNKFTIFDWYPGKYHALT